MAQVETKVVIHQQIPQKAVVNVTLKSSGEGTKSDGGEGKEIESWTSTSHLFVITQKSEGRSMPSE